jgi:Bcr/CflA subfamily drug resistance transporter
MKQLKKENEWTATVLAFVLIPLSGLAVDVYLPSFPSMVTDLGTTSDSIKLTMTAFLISYGTSQLFVGSIVDSFGRYRLTIYSLLAFILTNVGILLSDSITLIIFLRLIQGIAIGFIVTAKRAFFIDVYEGEKRKHYTSLITIVWASAPILAPFIGGYLQTYFGWRANFYLLSIYGLVMLLLELRYSGETIKKPQPYNFRAILSTYAQLWRARDYVIGVLVLGLSYGMVLVFGMSMPFIIEHGFHLSPVFTGYAALCSGVSILFGGILAKRLINKPFFQKLSTAVTLQLVIALAMYFAGMLHFNSILSIMLFVVLLHLLEGFTYNIYFTYCITRFPAFAGTAGGVTSGGSYIVFSLIGYLLASILDIHDQQTLALSYLFFVVAIILSLQPVKGLLKSISRV